MKVKFNLLFVSSQLNAIVYQWEVLLVPYLNFY